MNYFTSSSHMKNILEPTNRQHTIKWLLNELRYKTEKFDAIAVMGYSMALIAPTIADKLNKNLILIRKPGDNTHSAEIVEGPRDGRYIIIDDIANTCQTIQTIIDTIKREHCSHSKCVGILTFHHRIKVWNNSRFANLTTFDHHKLYAILENQG